MTDIQHERLLTELLNEIARADLQIDPPRGMEERVLAQWAGTSTSGAARIRRKPPTPVWLLPGVGALVAAVLLIVIVHRSSRSPAAVPMPVDYAEAGAHSTAVEAPTAGGPSPAISPRPIPIARREPAKRPQRAEASRAIVGFVPVSPDVHQDLLGSFQIARVLVPREVLADLGVVLDADRVGEPVQADVVFGEDGLARAVRLAPQDARRSR